MLVCSDIFQKFIVTIFQTTLNFFLYLNPCDEVHDTYEHDPCEESPCEQNTYEYNIPNHEFEDLKKQYKKAEDELLISRKCNENLVMKQSKLTAMAKELKSSAHLLNAGVLSAEDQYELAAILGDDSHDQRFITACIFILHKRDYAVIKNLTKSGRLGNKPNAKKLDPKINLTMRNMFSARVRKNSGSLKECQKRMELFDQLLVRGIDTAKKFIIRSESVG